MFAVVIVGMEITNDVKWGVTSDRRTRGKTRLRAPSHHVTITEGNAPLQRHVLFCNKNTSLFGLVNVGKGPLVAQGTVSHRLKCDNMHKMRK